MQKEWILKLLIVWTSYQWKLSQLPKLLNCVKLKRDFIPHFQNTKANLNYAGEYPDSALYGFEKRTFWTGLKQWKIMNLKEMLYYCKSDIMVGKQTCLTYWKKLLKGHNKWVLMNIVKSFNIYKSIFDRRMECEN